MESKAAIKRKLHLRPLTNMCFLKLSPKLKRFPRRTLSKSK